jgi:hypothetical protein
MNFNYTLKYRTFDQLMADARVDLKTFDLDNKIQPAELVKVATRVNYDLGLRIQQPKDYVIEIEKGKGKLPDDMLVVNYALVCADPVDLSVIPPQGTHTESINPMTGVVPQYTAMGQPSTCGCPNNQKVCMEWNKNQPIIIQKINTERLTYGNGGIDSVSFNNSGWRQFKRFYQLQFTNAKSINCECPNLSYTAPDQAYLKDGFIWTNMECGHIYINYQGAMEDSDGNLLVPDHPLLNEYYEYAIKQRILENLLMAGESVNAQIQIVEQRFRAARNNALSMVNTPNFSEMQKLWVANRLAQYSKYYDMFKSYAGQMSPRVNNAV